MSGVVIEFPGYWRGVGPRARARKGLPRNRKRPQHLKARVERIAALLTELEAMSPPSAEVLAILIQARATVSRVEEKLTSHYLRHSEARAAAEDEGDPQPHVDREVLEHLFNSRDQYQ